jgi:endonuclease G
MDERIMETAELALEWYAGSRGYDPEFLAQRVDLPALSAERCVDVVPLNDGSGNELKYTHFSVVMSKSRRLAFFTAVNIDGANLRKLPRDADRWYFDPRIERQYQMGPPAYSSNELDRGHLVRRIDPVWGDSANEANEDTFHFTNCSPQHGKLNKEIWLGLEDYILNKAKAEKFQVSVFSGPVFRDDDMLYRDEFLIPAEFWKVVVIVKDDGQLSATAYLQTQRDLITNLEAEVYGPYETYQVPVSEIERLTGLDFGRLRDHDPLLPPGLESTPRASIVRGPENLVL